MNKIEEVAKAICLAESRNPMERREIGEETFWEWELRVPAASAAIKAMMEPTEGMMKAAGGKGKIRYEAMITAAMEEEPG